MPEDDVQPSTLHIVSGKGGTGKTTVGATLACALATAGRRVLLVGVEGRHDLTDLLGLPPLEVGKERLLTHRGRGSLWGLAASPEEALAEYLRRFDTFGLARLTLRSSGLVEFATSIAPGLCDLLVLGKVYDAARRRSRDEPGSYDAVVLDAPPTGRILQFLAAPRTVAELVRVGPLRRQCDSVASLLAAATTRLHLVTTPTALAVTEALETRHAAGPQPSQPGLCVCNRAASPLPADVTLPAIDGLTPLQQESLAAEWTAHVQRVGQEETWRARLPASTVTLPALPSEVAAADLDLLAAVASAQTPWAELVA